MDLKSKAGQIHKNKVYGDTLRKFSIHGSNIFYSGEIADDILLTINNNVNSGFLSKKDLLLYEIKEKKQFVRFIIATKFAEWVRHHQGL